MVLVWLMPGCACRLARLAAAAASLLAFQHSAAECALKCWLDGMCTALPASKYTYWGVPAVADVKHTGNKLLTHNCNSFKNDL
jgi:hypothetical protein